MKKLILLLTIALILCSLGACGNAASDGATSSGDTSSPTATTSNDTTSELTSSPDSEAPEVTSTPESKDETTVPDVTKPSDTSSADTSAPDETTTPEETTVPEPVIESSVVASTTTKIKVQQADASYLEKDMRISMIKYESGPQTYETKIEILDADGSVITSSMFGGHSLVLVRDDLSDILICDFKFNAPLESTDGACTANVYTYRVSALDKKNEAGETLIRTISGYSFPGYLNSADRCLGPASFVFKNLCSYGSYTLIVDTLSGEYMIPVPATHNTEAIMNNLTTIFSKDRAKAIYDSYKGF